MEVLMKEKLYVAYGSNINLDQMAFRCPNSEVVGTAMLQGYELQFKRVATIEKNADAQTPVLIWKLPKEDERVLDRYEGFPSLYRKEQVSLEVDSQEQKAMVYIMNGNRPLAEPSMRYYECIQQGYIENGMDLSYLERALEQSQELAETEEEKLFMGWE